MSQKGEAPPRAKGLQKAPKTPGKLFPVLAVNPQPSSIFSTKPWGFRPKNSPLQPKLPKSEVFVPVFPQQGPAPRIPGRVLGWDGWKREFLPLFFSPITPCPCRELPARRAAPRRAPAPGHPPLRGHPLRVQGIFGVGTGTEGTRGGPHGSAKPSLPPLWGWVHRHGLGRGKPRPSPKPELFQARN